MSLILDALNRSRQDANPVPGLDTQHRAQPLSAERRPYLLWAALALCALVIVYLVVGRLRAPAAPAEDIGAPVAQLSQNLGSAVSSVTTELKARAAAAEQAQQPVVPAATTPVPAAVPAAQQNAAANQPVAPAQETSLAQSPPAQPVAARPDLAPASAVARSVASPPVSGAQDDEVAQLYQHPDLPEEPRAAKQSRAQSASAETEMPVDLDKVLKLAQEEMKNAKLEDNGVPFLADLSQQTKDGIPTIYYQKHDYSSDPAVSSVTFNGTNARAGGSPLPGLKVEEILPDSVVLSYQGTQFRLRALNSWVNL